MPGSSWHCRSHWQCHAGAAVPPAPAVPCSCLRGDAVSSAELFRAFLAHVLPALVASGAGFLLGGRRGAVTAAENKATNEALEATLRKIRGNGGELQSDPGNDEPTRPG